VRARGHASARVRSIGYFGPLKVRPPAILRALTNIPWGPTAPGDHSAGRSLSGN
jgi:hypothetical protein